MESGVWVLIDWPTRPTSDRLKGQPVAGSRALTQIREQGARTSIEYATKAPIRWDNEVVTVAMDQNSATYLVATFRTVTAAIGHGIDSA